MPSADGLLQEPGQELEDRGLCRRSERQSTGPVAGTGEVRGMEGVQGRKVSRMG